MGTKARDIIAEWKKNPSFMKEYEALAPEFEQAKALVAARARAGLSQAQLARKMKTTQPVIARLEGGRQKPSLKTLERYAKATGHELHIELVPVEKKRAAR
jgi:ribosome-binding protein aMBF1 (putative translation factor)